MTRRNAPSIELFKPTDMNHMGSLLLMYRKENNTGRGVIATKTVRSFFLMLSASNQQYELERAPTSNKRRIITAQVWSADIFFDTVIAEMQGRRP